MGLKVEFGRKHRLLGMARGGTEEGETIRRPHCSKAWVAIC